MIIIAGWGRIVKRVWGKIVEISVVEISFLPAGRRPLRKIYSFVAALSLRENVAAR